VIITHGKVHEVLLLAKLGPGKKRQTQIDGRSIESVNRQGQLGAKALVRVERTGTSDQHLREVGVDAPIAHGVRMGQGVARDLSANAEMIELGLLRAQTSFDVAQALAISQLRESHAKKLVPTREALQFEVALIAFDAAVKRFGRKKVHQLCKDRFARIHSPSPSAKIAEASAELVSNSNRSLCPLDLTFSISIP
jgi:hypothetical protein